MVAVDNFSLPLDELLTTVTARLTAWIHVPEARDDITIVLARKRRTQPPVAA